MGRVCLIEQVEKEDAYFLNRELEIMPYRSGNLLVDEIDLEAKLLRNKVADIIEDEFVKEINRIVHEEARRCCKGCEMDDTSQDRHDCLIREEEQYGFITMR